MQHIGRGVIVEGGLVIVHPAENSTMRLSTDSIESMAFCRWHELHEAGKTVHVYLDGAEMRDVVTADDELGLIVRNKRDADGDLEIDEAREELVRETLHGEVRIEVTN